jgi:hypothetical protein
MWLTIQHIIPLASLHDVILEQFPRFSRTLTANKTENCEFHENSK